MVCFCSCSFEYCDLYFYDKHLLKFSTQQAYGPESDIDVLCIGPYIATLQVSVNFVFGFC